MSEVVPDSVLLVKTSLVVVVPLGTDELVQIYRVEVQFKGGAEKQEGPQAVTVLVMVTVELAAPDNVALDLKAG